MDSIRVFWIDQDGNERETLCFGVADAMSFENGLDEDGLFYSRSRGFVAENGR